MFNKRIKVCLITGAVLGVICIVGAMIRSGFSREAYYLFAFWYNRLLMGLVIGLAAFKLKIGKAIARGAVLGLLVSFAFYSATGFDDVVGFIAGVMYGIIIELAAIKFAKDA